MTPASDLDASAVEAHAFEPGAEEPERCAVCGELRAQIRHHPTRVRAAGLLHGGEGPAGPDGSPQASSEPESQARASDSSRKIR